MKRVGLLILSVVALLLLVSPFRETSRAANPVDVTLSITRIVEIDCPEGAFEKCPGDYYPKADVGGQGLDNGKDRFCCAHGTDIRISDWVFKRTVDSDVSNLVPIHVELWDQDDFSPDNEVDIANGGNFLDLTYNLSTCTFTGGGLTALQGGGVPGVPGTSQGTPDDAAQIYFTITTPYCTDSDGDGLLDGWEKFGYDGNGNGFSANDPADVDLPAMGAKWNHKDLFLELDWEAGLTPTRASIIEMKAAFAAAPITAGSKASQQKAADNGGMGIDAPPNGDGPGINLWVDVGNVLDRNVLHAEDGVNATSCTDGIDNDFNGVTDAADTRCQFATERGGGSCVDGVDNDIDGSIDDADPDCLVGDFLAGNNTGGNVVAAVGCLDAAYYAVKNGTAPTFANPQFNPNRRFIFRYGISATSGPCGGGQAEIGGNEFVEFNHDGGTIMHELGHTLNLRHGGNVDVPNCKPNYVSGMNYDHQFGIRQAGGTRIIDYSPPRFSGGRSAAPLPTLMENALNETTILDPTDAVNQFVFVNGLGQKIRNQLNQSANWDGDATPNETSVPPVNIDTSTPPPNPQPAACSVNMTTNDTLTGFDDWSAISLPFRQFGDSADGALNTQIGPEPTLQELLDLERHLNAADLTIAKGDDPDPAVAGRTLKYTLTVRNNGPNPTNGTRIVDSLPAGTGYQSDDAGCVQAPLGTVTCNTGSLAVGQSKTIHITVLIAADLVYNAGGPTTISNRATVENLAGPDTDGSNNSATETTTVVAVADLAIVSFAPFGAPSEILVSQNVNVTIRKVVTNLGPSAPMDVSLTRSASAPPDSTITPTSSTGSALAVRLNEQRTVDEMFTVRCNGFSSHTFNFTNDIKPLRPNDTDPVAANNHAETSLNVTCVVPVAINIKPGSSPNSASLEGGSSIGVAVLTTMAGEYGNPLAFDARTIDPLSVRFGPRSLIEPNQGGATEIHNTGHLENSYELNDKTKDRDVDMVLHFDAIQTGLGFADTEACMKGDWVDSAGVRHRFFGCDSIRFTR